MSYPHKLAVGLGEPKFEIFASSLGDLDQLEIKNGHNMGNKMDLNGAGGDYEVEAFPGRRSLPVSLYTYDE
jgi:hypothetical protein